MEMTIDEYLAYIQSSENGKLEETLMAKAQKRYDSRHFGMYQGEGAEPTQQNEISYMTQDTFEIKRRYQMSQLYNAYKEKSHGRIWIEPNNNNMEAVRRVVGPHAGNVLNTGNLFLDQETIDAIQAIAEFSRHNNSYENGNWANSLTALQLESIIDELLACKEIINENNPDVSINTLANQTDALRRSIGKQNGRNVFGIKDYTATAEEITKRYTGFGKLINALKRMIHPPEKTLGNTEIDVQEIQ